MGQIRGIGEIGGPAVASHAVALGSCLKKHETAGTCVRLPHAILLGVRDHELIQGRRRVMIGLRSG